MENRQVLKDIRKNGKTNDWQEKKKGNLKYFSLLEELKYKKAERVQLCSEVLQFEKAEEGLKLRQAWFCKSRLCPICNWRKSLKHSNQVIQIVNEAVKRNPKGRFLFWTLTTKNVFTGKELNEEITKLSKAFNRLMDYKKIQKNMLGYLKATEVTVNQKDGSYNQHLHVLVFVKANYFSGKEDNYISQSDLTEFWKKALKIDYTPIVNIKAVKPKATEKEKGVIGAVYETAKYPVKSIDYLTNDRDENLQRVEDLEKGLKSKRLISFGGIFKEIRKELQLEDVESGDLIKTDSEEDKEPTTGQVIIARWNWQRQNYYLD